MIEILFPRTKNIQEISKILEKYKNFGVNTNQRLAHFLAQVREEVGAELKPISENLNYTEEGLKKTFKVFRDNPQLAENYGKDEDTPKADPVKIANYAYANKLGNGNPDSDKDGDTDEDDDGYKYRGRGLIQLTFRGNYQDFTISHNEKHPTDIQDFEQTPDLVATNYKYEVEAAFYFWRSRDINSLSDGTTDDDDKKITRAVNGGANGLQERIDKFRLAMELL
jgi:predicted chitinase